MHIKSMQQNSRPLERLINNGVQSLSDVELLAILIHSGLHNMSALDVAQSLLKETPLNSITTLHQCMQCKGIGKTKAARILAAREFGRRALEEPPPKGGRITSPKAVFKLMKHIGEKKQEHFYGIFLSVRKHIVHQELLFKGTLDAVAVHPREIIAKALEQHASGIIVVHNHPSGDCTPSDEDVAFTDQLHNACALLRVELLDHIIIGKDQFYSFKRKKAYKSHKHS